MMNLESKILTALNTHKKNPNPYTFSPSMLGNTTLQNFLAKVFDRDVETSVGHNTVGSIFHAGLNALLPENENELNEKRYEYLMSNGVTLTGVGDKFILTDGFITEIRDYKLTKIYAGKSLKKEPNHAYALQLSGYRFMAEKLNMVSITNKPKLVVDMFYKDADILLHEPVYEPIEVLYNVDIEEIILSKSNELVSYIDAGEMPAECENKDKWFRKLRNGTMVASRCVAYCGVKNVCPYFSGEPVSSSLASW